MSVPISYKADAMPAWIGVDIGGTNLRGALLGPTGEILTGFRIKTAISDGAAVFQSRLKTEIIALINQAAAIGLKVQGVGLGIPGLIGSDGTIHTSVNLKVLEGVNPARNLSQELKLPVVAGNDANLIALGEAEYGAGRGFRSLVVITLGTGLGSGLILDGRLWSGSQGFAAEFGHFTVKHDGRHCPCGNRGCLEQYASAPALSRFGGGRSPEELSRMAESGEQYAMAAFNKLGYWLGLGLAGLANTLNLDAIVIGGGVSASFHLFAPAIQKEISGRSFPQMGQNVTILKASLGDDAGLIGAAQLARTI